MSRREIGRNEPCPCGSGLKYKRCCYAPGATLVRDDETGAVHRVMPLSPEAVKIIKRQEEKFREKFGREMGPSDKIFWDAPPEEEIERLTIDAMVKTGMPPDLIYAYKKTGLFVTTENKGRISRKDLREWNAAVDEYRAAEKRGESLPLHSSKERTH